MQPPEVLPATLRTLGQLNNSMDRRGNQGPGPTSIHVPPPQYKRQPNTSDPKAPFLSPSRLPCNLPLIKANTVLRPETLPLTPSFSHTPIESIGSSCKINPEANPWLPP